MRAIVTIEFDDNWASNFTHAARAMDARGLKGVFNCISGKVEDWEPWRNLAGHEIANHTAEHPYFKDIKPVEAEQEIIRGFTIIRENIPGQAVPSFTYPGGSCPDWAPAITRQFHTSARCRQGIETWPPEDRDRLRGKGWYAPFSLAAMNDALDEAIRTGGWYIGYFHELTTGPERHLACPVSIFEAHLDYIASQRVEVVTRREAIGNLSAIDSKS